MPATGASAAGIFWKAEKNPSFPAEDLYAGRTGNLERECRVLPVPEMEAEVGSGEAEWWGG